MNFLKKKEKKSTESIYKCGGKIVLVSFDGLNPADFPYKDDLTTENIGEELILLSFDGKVYLNQGAPTTEGLAILFEILVRNPQSTLDKWRRDNKKRFANVTLDNLSEVIQDAHERACALAYLLIPYEMARRKVEKSYYSQK